ncbi:MAG: hypothetical protein LIP77_11080 [Planctomycetes bacterium]|nr:hypothetical protein [Planctomycetota bacterium]
MHIPSVTHWHTVPLLAVGNNRIPGVPISAEKQDTVELSGEYLRSRGWITVAAGENQPASRMWVLDPKTGVLSPYSPKEKYETLGLQGLKESLEPGNSLANLVERILDTLGYLPKEKRDIATLINSTGQRLGLSAASVRKMKIEVDADGRVVVGGLADKRALRAMEDALNDIDGFAERLVAYQTAERELYADYRNIPIREVRMVEDGVLIDPIDSIEQACAGAQSVADLDDLGPTSLAYAMAAMFLNPVASADFSHEFKGVANPLGDMERCLSDIQNGVYKEFLAMRDIDPEIRPTLDNVTVHITEYGEITIDGCFSEAPGVNARAEEIFRRVLQGYLEPDQDGREGLFTTALSRIADLHDEAYGEHRGERSKFAVFTWSAAHSTADAYMVNPLAEAQIRHDLKEITADCVKEVLPDVGVIRNDFLVQADGGIRYRGDADDDDRRTILALVNHLLERVAFADRWGTELLTDDPVDQAALAYRAKLAEGKSYGPDGDRRFLGYISPGQELKKWTEGWSNRLRNYPYVYSRYVPPAEDS